MKFPPKTNGMGYCNRLIGSTFPARPSEIHISEYLIDAPNLIDFDDNGIPVIHQRELTQEEFDGRLKEHLDSLTNEFKSLRQGQTWHNSYFYLNDACNDVLVGYISRVCLGKPIVTYHEGHFTACLNLKDKGSSAFCVVGAEKTINPIERSPNFGGLSLKKTKREAEQYLRNHKASILTELIVDKQLGEEEFDYMLDSWER